MSLLDRFRLDSKTCIVTGGDRGIGYAIAKGFGEVGANVVVANRDETACHDAAGAIADETGAETLAVPTDVTVDDDVTSLVAESVEAFGGG